MNMEMFGGEGREKVRGDDVASCFGRPGRVLVRCGLGV